MEPWLRDLEVDSAVTCIPGLASRTSRPFLLPRYFDTSQTTEAAFRSMIDGLVDFLPRRPEHRLNVARG